MPLIIVAECGYRLCLFFKQKLVTGVRTDSELDVITTNAAAVTVHDLGESCHQLWPVTGRGCLQSSLFCQSFPSAVL